MDFLHESCKKNVNSFCVVCANFVPAKYRRKSALVAEQYQFAFGKELPHGFPWIPTTCCLKCSSYLYKWKSGSLKQLPFDVPAEWNKPQSKSECYFCHSLPLIERKMKSDVTAVSTRPVQSFSVVLPFKHEALSTDKNSEVLRPLDPNIPDLSQGVKRKLMTASNGSPKRLCRIQKPVENPYPEQSAPQRIIRRRACKKRAREQDECVPQPRPKRQPGLFSQNELNNLVKQADISLTSAQVVVSKIFNKGQTDQSVRVSAFRKKVGKEFKRFFTTKGSGKKAYVVCNDVKGLLYALDGQFDLDEWRLFADGTSKTFVVALIHNTNKKPSIPLVFSRDKSENYDRMSQIWDDLHYVQLQLKVIADLKMLSILRGLLGGWPFFPCIFCMWNSRLYHLHYKKKIWPMRPCGVIDRSKLEKGKS